MRLIEKSKHHILPSEMSLDSDYPIGFQVKYLGSVSFTKKKRRSLKGIVSLQRPLLELYTETRRRGEHQRSTHPLALAQQLEVCEHGLVVAEASNRSGETIVTKVITPLDNMVLWAAVRFHARIVKKKVFGAAFVPLACSEGALEAKSYSALSSNQRFLVSLSHPSLFACLHRSLARPTHFSCHAFVCSGAEDALAIADLATAVAQHQTPIKRNWRRIPASIDSGTDQYYSDAPEERGFGGPFSSGTARTDTEEESNSYASVPYKPPALRMPPKKRFTAHREARALIGSKPRSDDDWKTRALIKRDERNSETELPSCSRDEPDKIPVFHASYRSTSTMTESPEASRVPPPTEVLVETIDLSSEKSSSSADTKTGGWRPLLPASSDHAPLVKYTYFGYETYAPSRHNAVDERQRTAQVYSLPRDMGEQRKSHSRHKSGGSLKEDTIQGNGTGKVIINVSYSPLRPDSRNSTSSTRTIPHGVRTFQRNGHPRNWSSLSQTTSSSSSSTTPRKASPKVIRWSSEERVRRPGGFFWSLRRLGAQSLTKAKHRTGKFISNMKTRLMGTKRSSADGSEDSAYDTSEVCLSPSGRQVSPSRQTEPKKVARRQQSWSFHDLRTVDRPVVRRSQQRRRGKLRKRYKRRGRSSSSSDSGVEAAYHSDECSGGRRSASDPGRLNVTRIQVHHGMGSGTFQRWSHTNLQDELGYIP